MARAARTYRWHRRNALREAHELHVNKLRRRPTRVVRAKAPPTNGPREIARRGRRIEAGSLNHAGGLVR